MKSYCLVGLGILTAMSVTWAAPVGSLALPQRPTLSSEQLKLITTPITREQQIRVLQGGPSAVQKQLRAALSISPAALGQTPMAREQMWRDGFDLLPYRVSYPPPGPNVQALAELRSSCVEIMGDDFPPRQDQPNPILRLWNPREQEAAIVQLRLHQPGAGLFMVTFSASCSGYISGKPPLLKSYYPGTGTPAQDTELLPSDSHSRWTCLVSLQDKDDAVLELWRPRVVVLGRITLRKL